VLDVSPFYYAEEGPEDLEFTIVCSVSPSERRALAGFGGGLRVSDDGRRLSARAASEDRAFLALNLAYEVMKGRRDQLQARAFYEHELRLRQAGRSSPYMSGLLYEPTPQNE
jgi:hypothetical protein